MSSVSALELDSIDFSKLAWNLEMHFPSSKGSSPELPTARPRPPSPTRQIINVPVPNLFALTIGINDYADEQIPNLAGAIADAGAIGRFLIQYLRVPPDHITRLYNSSATREAIERSIAALGDDERIKRDDPILIFYAGHGAEMKSPEGWPGHSKVQMLVPYDFIPRSTGDKERGQGVVDIRLEHLLEVLAEKKGNNITVILDCCHSSSGTQKDPSTSLRSIGLHPNHYEIAPALLEDIPKNYVSKIVHDRGLVGLASHVLLSGCLEDEQARETPQGGAFTQALLRLWKGQGAELLTYKDVVSRLHDLDLQHPQVKGANQSRILFDSQDLASRGIFAISSKNATLFVLEAGDAHGITIGGQFAIYDNLSLKRPLGNAEVKKVTASQSELVPIEGQELTLVEGAYAVQTHVGQNSDIKLLLCPDMKRIPLMEQIRKEMQNYGEADKHSIMLVDNEADKPDLMVSLMKEMGGEAVMFDIMDPVCRHHGLTRMPFVSPLATSIFRSVLRSSAEFYWNLNRSSHISLVKPKVSVSCYKLKESSNYDDNFVPILAPDLDAGDLNVGGTVTINVKDKAEYGYAIKNTSLHPLFVSAFYFDMSDLSVTSYYQPGSAEDGKVEPPVPPCGEITIGYGDSRTPSWCYFLRPNQNVDIGYLKLFISTTYVDLSDIVQQSPFQEEDVEAENKNKDKRVWDTVKIAIVQK